ncbi:response regulator [Methanoregula formicica]|uniref:CheY-like receiver domain-containing protein n=1 Tax=Methanoregula formicica (strain DSM 22288 / NBRC 105244 / SMSP) TaxID=593750 RepID=L0HF23_METFS|nr:response regulator [Methanoregula formicica]AGB03332.1 CheY-like receiver domain-containing protein [Methanoregula formicica SMSP]
MTVRVLYIEDNDQNFYLVNFILSAKGWTVIRANNGREGIDLAVKEVPDVILLDILLPVMDGYATARELRKLPGLSMTPIIAVTSYAMAGDREKALAAGCTAYIEKPINPKTFTDQVSRYLSPGSPWGEGP